jgi:TolB-like protein/Flp pilus assembly protein TadD
MRVYKFRNCLLNTAERSVIKENQHLDLTTKTFDVLEYLIENAGKVVSKDEILGHVWNGNFVEESNLPVHISKLRRSLSETRDYRFIETVQGTGYRFVAPLENVGHTEWHAALTASSFLQDQGDVRTALVHSVAVLPFHNEGADPNLEYLTDGLTESLINGLSPVPNLRVIARNTVFRYKNQNVDLRSFGATLGVSSVLTGRLRASDSEVTVSVELIRADDGTQIWGGQHRRPWSEVMKISDDVLFAVIENLRLTKFRDKLPATYSLSHHPESYRLYLKGRYLLEKHSADDIRRAVDFFNESVTLDPKNIYAHVEIVECYRSLHAYGFISYERFLEIARPVLTEISKGNQSLDVVQVLYSDLRMLEWKFAEAELYCKRALAINANSLKGRLRYSDLHLQSRNFKSALAQLERLMIIDPLSPLIYKRIGRLFYMMGEDESAISFLNDALELEPFNYEALALRGAVHTEMSNFGEALKDFEASLLVQPHPETLAMSAIVYAKDGNERKAVTILKKLETASTKQYGNSTTLAHIYLALGKKSEAYRYLEHAYAQHEPDLRALTYDRRWAAIRDETRFKSISKRIGLPDLD